MWHLDMCKKGSIRNTTRQFDHRSIFDIHTVARVTYRTSTVWYSILFPMLPAVFNSTFYISTLYTYVHIYKGSYVRIILRIRDNVKSWQIGNIFTAQCTFAHQCYYRLHRYNRFHFLMNWLNNIPVTFAHRMCS